MCIEYGELHLPSIRLLNIVKFQNNISNIMESDWIDLECGSSQVSTTNHNTTTNRRLTVGLVFQSCFLLSKQ